MTDLAHFLIALALAVAGMIGYLAAGSAAWLANHDPDGRRR